MNTRTRIALLAIAAAFQGCAVTTAAPTVVHAGYYEEAAPDAGIGVHVSVYPELVQVPGYPVYYAPQLPANYFFHDGYYWVYHADRWYFSDWYDGPWTSVVPDRVPLFVLRVPVRYYLRPPPHFRAWHADAPPRWDQHWGPRWTHAHRGWDRWDRRFTPAPAPLPAYQRQYEGGRYPRGGQRDEIRREHGGRAQREAAGGERQGPRRAEPQVALPPPRAAGEERADHAPRRLAPYPAASPPQRVAGQEPQRAVPEATVRRMQPQATASQPGFRAEAPHAVPARESRRNGAEPRPQREPETMRQWRSDESSQRRGGGMRGHP